MAAQAHPRLSDSDTLPTFDQAEWQRRVADAKIRRKKALAERAERAAAASGAATPALPRRARTPGATLPALARPDPATGPAPAPVAAQTASVPLRPQPGRTAGLILPGCFFLAGVAVGLAFALSPAGPPPEPPRIPAAALASSTGPEPFAVTPAPLPTAAALHTGPAAGDTPRMTPPATDRPPAMPDTVLRRPAPLLLPARTAPLPTARIGMPAFAAAAAGIPQIPQVASAPRADTPPKTRFPTDFPKPPPARQAPAAAQRAAAAPGAARIVAHIPVAAGDAAAARLRAALTEAGHSARRIVTVGFSVSHNAVRYFHAADRARAVALAADLNRTAARPYQVTDFTFFSPRPSSGSLEVWRAGL